MTPNPCSASTSSVGRLAVILAEMSCVSVIRIRKIATTVTSNHSWVRRYKQRTNGHSREAPSDGG